MHSRHGMPDKAGTALRMAYPKEQISRAVTPHFTLKIGRADPGLNYRFG